MKKILLIIMVLLSASALRCQVSTFYDTRDSQLYNKITIGTQIWMAENLNYETDESWCYSSDTAECSTYGRLYDWYQADTICPDGWHLPTDTEWKILETYIGMSSLESERIGYRQADGVGCKLKYTEGWTSFGNGTNDYLFSILPAGFRGVGGSFLSLGYNAVFWTDTESAQQGYYRMFYWNDGIERNLINKQYGLSIRCLKD